MKNDGLTELLAKRFGTDLDASLPVPNREKLAQLAGHAVCRKFARSPVDSALVRTICACALSAPSKSDLQQRDIIVVKDARVREELDDILNADWIRRAPVLLVVCANGRRLPLIAERRGKPFPNDHFDLLFNAVGDAAICLAWLQLAVDMAGLGGCPLSSIRDRAADVSRILKLPDRVIPFAGFCLGWPEIEGDISPRLPLSMTVHENSYGDPDLGPELETYDRRRERLQPYARQRDTETFGQAADYGWSEDKARQYAVPLRADFGAFLRKKGFSME